MYVLVSLLFFSVPFFWFGFVRGTCTRKKQTQAKKLFGLVKSCKRKKNSYAFCTLLYTKLALRCLIMACAIFYVTDNNSVTNLKVVI